MPILKLDSVKIKKWMKDRWQRYASSSSYDAKLLTFEVNMDNMFRVRHGQKTVYLGHCLEDATERFNEFLSTGESFPLPKSNTTSPNPGTNNTVEIPCNLLMELVKATQEFNSALGWASDKELLSLSEKAVQLADSIEVSLEP